MTQCAMPDCREPARAVIGLRRVAGAPLQLIVRPLTGRVSQELAAACLDHAHHALDRMLLDALEPPSPPSAESR